MKKGAYLAGGLIIGLLLGWVGGYLRLPLIPQAAGFWVGLLAGITLLSLILVIGRMRKGPSAAKNQASRLLPYLIIFAVAGGLLGAWLIQQERRSLQSENQLSLHQLSLDSLMLHRQVQMQQAQLMMDFLEEVRFELDKSAGTALEEEFIDRLARISADFEPYPLQLADKDSSLLLSPERGKLLQSLLSMEMDSTVFGRIKKKVSFAHAELQGVNLKGIDLSHADLRAAYLSKAILNELRCRNCNLHGVDFTAAKANAADFTGSNMRRAIFHWTEAKEIILRSCMLDGADMANAGMENADLSESMYQWGEMEGANLSGASILKVDFKMTGMKGVNFSKANLTESSLRLTNVKQANFQDAILLNMSVVESDWLDQLQDWSASGYTDLQQRYQVVKDTVVRYHNSKFVLANRIK